MRKESNVVTETATKLVTRAVVMRRAQYNSCPPYGQAPVGSLIPWAANLERLGAMGYVGKAEVDEATLKNCPHCKGLQFLNDKLLAEHVEADEKRIAEIRVIIPHLEDSARRYDQQAKDMQPRRYEDPAVLQSMKQSLMNSAQTARDDAAAFGRELASLTGEGEAS